MKKRTYRRLLKKEISIIDVWSIAIFIGIILFCFIYTPTLNLVENKVYNFLFDMYESHMTIYTVIANILLTVFSLSVYFLIKIIYLNKNRNYFFVDEMQVKYVEFLKGAKSIYIYSGDLGFLVDNDEQYRLIKRLGKKSYIIFDGLGIVDRKEELYNRILELKKSGVNIRKYNSNDEKIVFRGQIRVDARGKKECLFVEKKQNSIYYEIKITDQFITKVLISKFWKAFNRGGNAFISTILFDLGGVYLNGDFIEDFLEYLKSYHNIIIKPSRNDKLFLDVDLSLGKITIVQWIEKRTGIKLKLSQKEEVERKWSEIWTPNNSMCTLIEILKRNYFVTASDNIDRENGLIYFEKGYFNCFQDPIFLSYQLGKCKPDHEFWLHIFEELNVYPQQVLLIDDHEENINKARKEGMETIRYSVKNQSFEYLEEQLKSRLISI